MRRIFEQDGAVPGVLQIDRDRRLALHRHRVLDDLHVLPGAAVAVLVGVRRVRVVDIQVFGVGSEDRQSPRAIFVVPDRNTWQHRLAAADDVPSRPDQMNPVAQ